MVTETSILRESCEQWTMKPNSTFIGLFLSLIDFDTLRLNDNAVSASVHEAQPLGLNALDLSQKMG